MEDSNCWDCSVCTFRNSPEAFKCLMCDVRKGTSTRKPRINPEMVAKQVARQQEQIKQQALKSVVKPARSIGSEKSAFHRTDDNNSNSSISSSYDSSGRISPVANGSNCSNGSASSLSTAISTSSFFDMNSSNNTFNTASGSTKSLNLPSSSRVSSKIDSEEEVDENELERKKPVSANQNCNKTSNRKLSKQTIGPKAKLKNVDRSDALYKEVTVNNFTVLITEFKPKRKLSEFTENHQNKSSTDLSFNNNINNSNKKTTKESVSGVGDINSSPNKSNLKSSSNSEQKKSPNKSINKTKEHNDQQQTNKKRSHQVSASDSFSSEQHSNSLLNNSVTKKVLPGVEQATK